MNFKAKLIEFVIKSDLMPEGIRWKVCANGVGRLFNDVFKIIERDQRQDITKLMYEWGIADADRVIEALKAERDLHGCAIAVIGMNQIFGIKSHIQRESSEEVIVHATECLWKDLKDWTPEVCSSISAYDVGLVAGINKDVRQFFTKRRSMGDNVCELVLKKS